MNRPTANPATPTPAALAATAAARPTFGRFYREVFLPEHRHPANVALHMAGTVAGLVFIAAVLAAPPAWWFALPLFPVVHAAPGLLGHRFLERNQAVGDARWRRTDFPSWWFIVGNHRMTFERVFMPSLWRRDAAVR